MTKSTHKYAHETLPLGKVLGPEHLRIIRDLCSSEIAARTFNTQPFQTPIILDANAVIADILWLVGKRKNPNAFPALLGNVVAGTFVAYAPYFLLDEIEKNLPILARNKNLPLPALQTEWKMYQSHIVFMDGEAPTELEVAQAQDPKDLPYIKLQEKIKADICSSDTDIIAMNGRIMGVPIIDALYEYSGHVAIEYTVKFMGIGAFVVTENMVKGIIGLLRLIRQQVAQIPKPIMAGIIFVAIYMLLKPSNRERVVLFLKGLSLGRIKNSLEFLLAISVCLLEKHQVAQEKAELKLKEVLSG